MHDATLGLRVEGSELRVQGFRFGLEGLGFGDYRRRALERGFVGSGVRVWGSEVLPDPNRNHPQLASFPYLLFSSIPYLLSIDF